MALRPSPSGEDGFDAYDEFVPEHLPDPGPFLGGHAVLRGDDHAAFHATTREVFEERGVYDATFGYNLARLNLDRRHPDAGYRYAEEGRGVLRAEFTPTTPFCPQSGVLVAGSFRAWNGLPGRHGYDLVRVRIAPVHDESESINDRMASFEKRYRETGSLRAARSEPGVGSGRSGDGPTAPF